jgi:hypothetical protein
LKCYCSNCFKPSKEKLLSTVTECLITPSSQKTLCVNSATHYIIIVIGIIIIISQVFFSLVLLLLSEWWTPPLRLQVSDCSTFLMMCHVPSTAFSPLENLLNVVFVLFRDVSLNLYFLVAPMITSMTKHFMLHIHWIFILRFLYYNSFSAPFCITFLSDDIATLINNQVLSFLFLTIMSGLFARNSLSICTSWFHNTYIFMFSYRLRYVEVPKYAAKIWLTNLWVT